MLVVFLALAIASLICLVGGSIWAFIKYGQGASDRGPEVGARIMDGDGRGVFRGKGIGWSGEVSISIVDLVAAWRSGQRREVLPFVVALAGFEGALIFGGIALLLGVDVKIFGWIVLATGLYGLWLMANALRKGEP